MNNLNDQQKYIFSEEQRWLQKYRNYLTGSVLKVGNGLGYLSGFIKEINPDLVVIDIKIDKDCINKKDVTLYEGQVIPFPDSQFDIVVCTYILHHTPNPEKVLKEMRRVGNRIIILEETYETIFQKLDIVWRDIYVNVFAGQFSKIYWNSYFKKDNLKLIIYQNDLRVIDHLSEKKRSYHKELYILERIEKSPY